MTRLMLDEIETNCSISPEARTKGGLGQGGRTETMIEEGR